MCAAFKGVHFVIGSQGNGHITLSGPRDSVYRAGSLIEMMLESPRKKCGVLFKVPDSVTGELSVLRGEIAAHWGRLPKSSYTALETDRGYRAFFAPGLPSEHYPINTYMTRLIAGEPLPQEPTTTYVANTEPIKLRSSLAMPYN